METLEIILLISLLISLILIITSLIKKQTVGDVVLSIGNIIKPQIPNNMNVSSGNKMSPVQITILILVSVLIIYGIYYFFIRRDSKIDKFYIETKKKLIIELIDKMIIKIDRIIDNLRKEKKETEAELFVQKQKDLIEMRETILNMNTYINVQDVLVLDSIFNELYRQNNEMK